MAVTAFRCPECGAKLQPAPAALQATCEYCGATSRIQRKTGMFRAPPPPQGDPRQPVAQPYSAGLKVWYVAAAIGSLIMMASMVLVFQTSPASSITRATAADYTRGATYGEGESVKLWYVSTWYDATILEVRSGGRYLVGYDGWSASWNEVVTKERLQKRR